jgi:hypothetical protein
MALKLRRGTNSGRTAITPAEGEPIYTTDTKELYVGDGTTAGGIKITGGLADGDKGDITVSSSGATWTVDNDAVTYAKIQNVSAASKLLGRGDSGSGDVQEITLGDGLTMTGTTLAASGGGGGLGAPTYVVTKTADETVTDSTTLQDDDELYQALTSGKSYIVEFRLLTCRTNTTNTVNLRVAVAGNSEGGFYTVTGGGTILASGSAPTNISTPASNEANIPWPGMIEGRLQLTSDFTVRLKFAQWPQVATTGIKVMKGSQLLIWEVA